MIRLYDRLLVSRSVERVFVSTEPKQAPVVVADNVAEYWYSQDGEWGYNDFPNIAPPLSPMFVEFRVSTNDWVDGYPIEWGGLFTTVAGDSARRILEHAPHWCDGMQVRYSQVEWLHMVEMFAYVRRAVRLIATALVPVDEFGQIPEGAHVVTTGATKDVPEGQLIDAGKALMPMLLAISFMHCKNVAQREVQQPMFERQVWRKKHGRPLVRYRMLDIDPMRKVLKTEGGSDEVGLKKALHICRGHFATYGKDGKGKLFGKHEGTFWVPQHVKGSAKQGTVVKDYRVHPSR